MRLLHVAVAFGLASACTVEFTLGVPDAGSPAGGGGAAAGGGLATGGGAGGSHIDAGASGGGGLGGGTGATDAGVLDGGGSFDGGAGCVGLDFPACQALPGCKPVRCPDCMTCTDTYAGCTYPGGPTFACPGFSCNTTCCASDTQCAVTSLCAAPVERMACASACTVLKECSTDNGCMANEVCDTCDCNFLPICQPDCNAVPCPEGQSCGSPAQGRCVQQTCATGNGCPLGTFICSGAGVCERKPCTMDSDCSDNLSSYCVNNFCYRSRGVCMP